MILTSAVLSQYTPVTNKQTTTDDILGQQWNVALQRSAKMLIIRHTNYSSNPVHHRLCKITILETVLIAASRSKNVLT